ncbi:MAG: DUF1830 domain-containing protein [Myxacorys californica WJT36-NPBG1]|nr:DUF1830 domain-containing protein [Myxacorys californica WJT36-NPBG1]
MDRGDANPKHPSPEKGSVTRTITIQSPSKIVYEFVLSGNINEFDKQRLEAIVAHLQQITGDVNLTLLRVEDGSVKLIFEGSEEGFKRIQELIEEGRLTEILGAQIQAVQEQQPLRTAEYRRSLILDPIPSSTSNSVLCCYVNGTSQIQIARITNVQNWYFERVVFPGQRLIFEAVPEAILEIHTGTMASAILSDTIPCTDLSLTAVDELDKYSSDQLARPFIEEERSI